MSFNQPKRARGLLKSGRLLSLSKLICFLMSVWLPSTAHADCVGPAFGGNSCGGGDLSALIPLAGLAIDIVGDIASPPARLSCRTGYVAGPNGGCMPAGSQDCGNGNYCSPGYVCAPGGCMPAGTTFCGGTKYCEPGFVCTGYQQCRTPAEIAAQRQRDRAAAARAAAFAACNQRLNAASQAASTGGSILDSLTAERNALTAAEAACIQFDEQRNLAAEYIAKVDTALVTANSRNKMCQDMQDKLAAGKVSMDGKLSDLDDIQYWCSQFPDTMRWVAIQTQQFKAAADARTREAEAKVMAEPCPAGQVRTMDPQVKQQFEQDRYGPYADVPILELATQCVAAAKPAPTPAKPPTSIAKSGPPVVTPETPKKPAPIPLRVSTNAEKPGPTPGTAETPKKPASIPLRVPASIGSRWGVAASLPPPKDAAALLNAVASAITLNLESTVSGFILIDGTNVFVVVDIPAHIAFFSSACGGPVPLTQAQLQAGAIPGQPVVPCSAIGPSPVPPGWCRSALATLSADVDYIRRGIVLMQSNQTAPFLVLIRTLAANLQHATVCPSEAAQAAALMEEARSLFKKNAADRKQDPGTCPNDANNLPQYRFMPGYGQPMMCVPYPAATPPGPGPSQSTITGSP